MCICHMQTLPDINYLTNGDTRSCVLTAISQTTPNVGFWIANDASSIPSLHCQTLDASSTVNIALCEDNQAFVCLAGDCGDTLPTVHNGMILIPTQTTFQSSTTATCNLGYILNGVSSVTCDANAKWSNPGQCT